MPRKAKARTLDPIVLADTGRRPIGTTANPDWAYAEEATDLVPLLLNDQEDADEFVRLCGLFIITQGEFAGHRLHDVWLPWQQAALRAMFQSRTTFLLVGKGSGKSTLLAAACLAFVMLCVKRGIGTRGLVVCLASSAATAQIVAGHLLQCVLADPDLRPRFKSNTSTRTVTEISSGISVIVLAPTLDQAVGRRPLFLCIDELHILAENKAEASAVLNQLRQGAGNFDNSKTVYISTMSVKPPVGEMRKLLEHSRKVRDGIIKDDTWLPLLFEYPVHRQDLNVFDQSTWWRGMPSLKHGKGQLGTMSAKALEAELNAARISENKEEFVMLLSQRLGIQPDVLIDQSQNVIRSALPRAPEAANTIVPGSKVAIGIDVGGLNDPMAVCTLWSTPGSSDVHVHVSQYIAQVAYDRAPSSNRLLFDDAVANGTLSIFPSVEGIDEAVARSILATYRALGGSVTVGGDQYGRSGFKQAFEERTGITFVPVPQNFLMSSALAGLEALLIDGKLHAKPCPLLRANAENLSIDETPNGTRRIRKADAKLGQSGEGSAKIDGIAAMLCAVHLQHSVESIDVDAMIA